MSARSGLRLGLRISPIMPKNSRIMSVISLQYTTHTDTSVPRWSSTSKSMCPSSAVLRWNMFWITDRWPELDTGRNSVIPCSSPRSRADVYVIAYASIWIFGWRACVSARS